MGNTALSRRDIWKQGHWLTADRFTYSNVWKQANATNLQRADGYKEYTRIGQRADFYGWFQKQTEAKGHETKWAGAAYVIAKQMELTDDPIISMILSNEVLQFAEDGNKAIFDDVFDNLRDLYNGDIKTGQDATNWDINTLWHEQFEVVEDVYGSQSHETISTLDKMAKQKGLYRLGATPPLKFEGKIDDPQDRFDHGMNKAVPFWNSIKDNPNME